MVRFTQDRKLMGDFASGPAMKWAAWVIAAVVIALNLNLLAGFVL